MQGTQTREARISIYLILILGIVSAVAWLSITTSRADSAQPWEYDAADYSEHGSNEAEAQWQPTTDSQWPKSSDLFAHEMDSTLSTPDLFDDPYLLVDTPSKNISCEIHKDYAACSIAERHYAENGARDCSSQLFSIKVGDTYPEIVCGQSFLGTAGDSVYEMQYGETVRPRFESDYACKAEETGVSCWNEITNQGFKLSRQRLEYLGPGGC